MDTESVASNSAQFSEHQRRSPSPRLLIPTQKFADRILRALRHPLRLLHRSDSSFFILGATGNVYIVTLSVTPSCTCPDWFTPCKHILFVLIKVLGIPIDDTCLRRRTLRHYQLRRLLGTSTSPEALANPNLCHRFHQLFHLTREGQLRPALEIEDGAKCPVCWEEMGREDRVVVCRTCRNPIHEECFMTWKITQGRGWASCVLCRARWRNMAEQERYLNLSSYLSEEDDMAATSGGACGGG